MSSSFRLFKRRQEKNLWTIPGPPEHHYIRPFGECHPEYTALPIGQPDGVKICSRTAPEIPYLPKPDPERTKNRYYKFSSRLYEPENPKPVQMLNPTAYDDRFGPHRGIYLAKDYYRSEVKYDGIGGYPLPTCTDRARYEYGVSQIADRPSYDVTRLHQLAPMWERSVQYHSPETEAVEQPCQNIVLGDPVHHPTLPPCNVSGLGVTIGG
jgi:hypothetical protein